MSLWSDIGNAFKPKNLGKTLLSIASLPVAASVATAKAAQSLGPKPPEVPRPVPPSPGEVAANVAASQASKRPRVVFDPRTKLYGED